MSRDFDGWAWAQIQGKASAPGRPRVEAYLLPHDNLESVFGSGWSSYPMNRIRRDRNILPNRGTRNENWRRRKSDRKTGPGEKFEIPVEVQTQTGAAGKTNRWYF